jgi:Bacterial Ig domain
MLHITVDDYHNGQNACLKCCCEPLALKPGTTTKVLVNYAPWGVPIGQLHCDPQFQLDLMDTCPAPLGANLPPQATAEVKFSTPMNAQLESTLANSISDPEGLTVTFKVLPLYGPKHGKLTLQTNGAFTYMPQWNYFGEERFYVTASDGIHSATFEVMIAIGIDTALMAHAPHIIIGTPTVDKRFCTVSFPVTMMPNADPCEVWRLTVLQAAIDCGCTCYTRTDCFDVKVAAC